MEDEDIACENGLLRQLTKAIIERALRAGLTAHLGYEKHAGEGHGSGTRRNGASRKRLKGDFGAVVIEVPRDREASFEPKLVGKGETRWHGFGDKILEGAQAGGRGPEDDLPGGDGGRSGATTDRLL